MIDKIRHPSLPFGNWGIVYLAIGLRDLQQRLRRHTDESKRTRSWYLGETRYGFPA